MNHRLDAFAVFHAQNVDNSGTACGASGFGNLVTLFAVGLAGVGEKEDIVMGGRGEHIGGNVFITRGNAASSDTAAGLCCVFTDGCPFNITLAGKGEHAFLLFNQILVVNFLFHVLNFGKAFISKASGNLNQFLFENFTHKVFIGQNAVVVGNVVFQFLIFGLKFFAVETLKGNQAHITDGGRLNFIQ